MGSQTDRLKMERRCDQAELPRVPYWHSRTKEPCSKLHGWLECNVQMSRHWTLSGRSSTRSAIMAPTQLSCQAHRNVKNKEGFTMRASKEKEDRSSNVHARKRHKATCTCVCVSASMFVERGAPFCARQGTLTVQLARPAAPHPPSSVQPHCTPQSVLPALLGGGRRKADVS